MGKKPKFIPPPYAYHENPKGVFSGIYASQIQSKAFMELSDKQKVLYIFMRMQENASNRPPREFGPYTFYFPKSLWSGVLGLYVHDERYYRDVDALIENGLIDCVSSGYTVKKPSVYRLSERWKRYGEEGYEVPANVRRMQRPRNKNHPPMATIL